MSAAIDPILSLAPVESPPPAREAPRGEGEFARHLRVPEQKPAQPREPEQVRKEQRTTEQVEPRRVPEDEQSELQSPATEAATTADDAGDQPPAPVAEDEAAVVEPDAPAEEVVEVEAIVDEVVLASPPTQVTAVVTPVAVEPEPETAVVAIVADDETSAKSQPQARPIAISGKQQPVPAVVAPDVLPATANDSALQAADVQEVTMEAGEQTPNATASPELAPTEGLSVAPVETSTKSTQAATRRTSRESRRPSAGEGSSAEAANEEAATEQAEAQNEHTLDVDTVAPRAAKRERLKPEAKAIARQAELSGPAEGADVAAKPIAEAPAAPTLNIAQTDAVAALERTVSSSAAAAPTSTSPSSLTPAPRATDGPQFRAAKAANEARGGAPVTPAEQTRFVQRVAKAFHTAQSRGGELQLRLSPPALGSLKLEIKVQSGVMTARVEAETQQAQALLMDNLPALKERLAEQGIVVEKFDVDLMDRQPQGQPDSPQERERHAAAARAPRMARQREPETNTPATTVPHTLRPGDGRLNITV